MIAKYSCTFRTFISSHQGSIKIEDPNICPICKRSIKPVLGYALVRETTSNGYIGDIMFICTSCNSSFIAHYLNLLRPVSNQHHFEGTTFQYTAPEKYVERIFEDSLINLSPKFSKIYNQASSAESASLDELAGIGYRKALEFLIKDYAVSNNPTAEDKIKSMPLMACVKSYIDNERIKLLAEKSAWLGNDETHYVRKHQDYNVNDMKRFLEALIHYVSMELITIDAASISPK